MTPRNVVVGIGILVAVGGGIAALSLYPDAHRSCLVPSGTLDQAQANTFSQGCVDHGVAFVVAVGVLALGAFVVLNGLALSLGALRRPRAARRAEPPSRRLDHQVALTDSWEEDTGPSAVADRLLDQPVAVPDGASGADGADGSGDWYGSVRPGPNAARAPFRRAS